MKKINKEVYIVDLLILILSVILLFFRKNSGLVVTLYFIFWIVLLVSLLLIYGYQKNNNYFKTVTIRYTIICCLSYLIIIYLLGLLLGFVKLIYSHSIIGIIKNISYPIVIMVSQEIVRYIICKRSFKDKKGLYLFTLAMIIDSVVFSSMYVSLANSELIFIFICVNVLPNIARQTLFTYLTYEVSYVPNLIVRFGYEVLPYFLPIYPDLGNYLTSVFEVALPFLIFIVISKILRYHDKKKLNNKRMVFNITIMPLFVFAGVLVLLISGIFKYKLVAIASDSMNPIYYRGDAVIYEKVKPLNIKKGEILVYKHGDLIITHRVIKKFEKDGFLYFQTKGDNNKSPDPFEIRQEDVLGRVNYIVKYVGYPTLWYSELFKK